MPALPCPNCGADLANLEQYHRQFCYSCGQYAPEGYGDQGARRCSSCGGILAYVAAYDRFYCWRCNLYPSVEREATSTPAPATTPEPVSGETRHPEPAWTVGETDERPVLTRGIIQDARKAQLLDLCKAYDLDSVGTKEQLRERLLSYLGEREGRREVLETPLSPAPTEPEPPTMSAPTEEPESVVTEAPSEGAIEREEGTLVVVDERPPRTLPSIPEVSQEPIQETPVPLETAEPVAEDLGPVAASVSIPRAEHPCPTCGRELDFIAQYGRWYCHGCKAYAPAHLMKHACPTCGASLRWIERYARWWCDAEQRYAPADLPGPAGEIAGGAMARSMAVRTTQVATPTVPAHRHGSPRAALGLAAFGLFLLVTYEIFVELPQLVAVPFAVSVAADVAFLTRFLGIFLLGVGVLSGLASVRGRG